MRMLERTRSRQLTNARRSWIAKLPFWNLTVKSQSIARGNKIDYFEFVERRKGLRACVSVRCGRVCVCVTKRLGTIAKVHMQHEFRVPVLCRAKRENRLINLFIVFWRRQRSIATALSAMLIIETCDYSLHSHNNAHSTKMKLTALFCVRGKSVCGSEYSFTLFACADAMCVIETVISSCNLINWHFSPRSVVYPQKMYHFILL